MSSLRLQAKYIEFYSFQFDWEEEKKLTMFFQNIKHDRNKYMFRSRKKIEIIMIINLSW